MVHKYDTERAVGLLSEYQASLTHPEEEALKNNVGKVSAIFGSQLFQALLDIQECYEVTLQLNTTESGLKENGAEEEVVEEEVGRPQDETLYFFSGQSCIATDLRMKHFISSVDSHV
ncbi:disks large homolog 1-like [Clupea harengus]|uniref:Disks large homolog 1-like n=1 Tax=Clupea harengus TaxID=7950 RepID=A0A6P8GWM6_CLUHA|nr:disks large homolog 1-like [Clupea harengus]